MLAHVSQPSSTMHNCRNIQQRSALVRPTGAFSIGRPVQASGHLRHRQSSSRGLKVITAVLEVTSENFDAEVVQSEKPVLMDFWAPWCGPCALILPSIEWAEKEYASQLKVVKVHADNNKDLVTKYKVYGLPTILMVQNGEKIAGSHHEGAITKAKLVDYLERNGFSLDS